MNIYILLFKFLNGIFKKFNILGVHFERVIYYFFLSNMTNTTKYPNKTSVISKKILENLKIKILSNTYQEKCINI